MASLPVYPYAATQTAHLRRQLAEAMAALPPAHLLRPVQDEVYLTAQEAYKRLKNWGFTQGHALVVESSSEKRGRWEIECSRHHDETRNVRKTKPGDKRRLNTDSQANGCKFHLYISQRKKFDGK
jgi:hypothetical protein